MSNPFSQRSLHVSHLGVYDHFLSLKTITSTPCAGALAVFPRSVLVMAVGPRCYSRLDAGRTKYKNPHSKYSKATNSDYEDSHRVESTTLVPQSQHKKRKHDKLLHKGRICLSVRLCVSLLCLSSWSWEFSRHTCVATWWPKLFASCKITTIHLTINPPPTTSTITFGHPRF